MTKSRDTADINSGTNTAVGEDALQANTTASNTAVGYQAGYANTTGIRLSALGYQALYTNTTGTDNDAFGHQALRTNNGNYNQAFGRFALYSNTSGTSNVAMGSNPLYTNTTGSYNVALGMESLLSNTTASSNTAVGYQALYDNTTSSSQTAIGQQALANITGQYNGGNTAVGQGAGFTQTSGYSNTYVGYSSGYNMTSGIKNTIIGSYNGNQSGLDIRTSNNNIVLSDGDGNPRVHVNYAGSVYLGGPTFATGASFLSEGASSGTNNYRATNNGGYGIAHFYSDVGSTSALKAFVAANGTFQTASDYRIKENVTEITDGISRINALRPVSYNQIGTDLVEDGFLAHELQEVIPHLVTGDKDGLKDDGSMFIQAVNHQGILATLVSAIKEQQETITALTARITTLEG